jgi:dynein heavy chain
MPEDQREPFYDWIAKDKEIVKVILLLTGSIQGTKNNVNKFLDSFEKYNWLWKKKIDKELTSFNDSNPQLEDFEAKLSDFATSESEVGTIMIQHQIGALSLKTNNVKTGLQKWIVMWKDAFAKDLLKKAQSNIDNLTEEIKHIRLKIEKPAKDVDSLGNVMYALEEIRKKQSTIDIEFRPVIEMYNLLENYLEDEDINKEGNKDPSQIINKDWDELVQQAVQVRNNLQGQQSEFKKTLIVGVKVLVEDVVSFRKNFEENGPMVAGIEPKEALNRLKLQSEEYQIRERKFNSYNAGEVLFGLPHQSYPELDKTKKEIDLLDKLYSLYSKVKDTISKWKDVPWTEIAEERATM